MCFIKKVNPLIIFLVYLLLGASSGHAQSSNAISDKNPLRLFVIGNSFTRNATAYLPELAKEAGEELIIGTAQVGGGPLKRHWEAVELSEAEPNNPKSKIYDGKSLKELLGVGVWDVVTIQQYSFHSSDVDTYQPYAKNLYSYIKRLQPNAVIFIHQTWVYRSDSKNFGQITQGRQTKNQQEMWEKSRAAYHQIAQELNINIIPTGDAFWLMTQNPKWSYKADPSFNEGNYIPPALPDQTKSLHVGYYWAKDKMRFDDRHANVAGRYLGSLIWYTSLYNLSPKRVKFIPEGLSHDFAKQLQNAAFKAAKNHKKHN